MQNLANPLSQRPLQLDRLPLNKSETLRPWDGADEYLLGHLVDSPPTADRRCLIINDQFGALSSAIAQLDSAPQISNWGDSKLAQLACHHNLALNGLALDGVELIDSGQLLEGYFDTVIIKVPKVLALLEVQLAALAPHIDTDTAIIAGGMAKHIHNSTLALFERYIGVTKTSLAIKKARLIFSQPDADILLKKQQTDYPIVYQQADIELSLHNHANVFSKDKLDIGARFFIEQFAKLPVAQTVVDLGCGNGVLGVSYKRQQPEAQIHFIDESFMALDSARENVVANIGSSALEHCLFHSSDCLSQYSGPSPELILCNPPFHQQHAVGDQIAWRMFQQAFSKLDSGGQLWVVANRHLHYHSKLKRLFGGSITIAANNKFVVLQAIKR